MNPTASEFPYPRMMMPKKAPADRPNRPLILLLSIGFVLPFAFGCGDDAKTVRRIQAARQTRQQSDTKVDHLGEAMRLVDQLIELNLDSAGRQIIYHLNAWREANRRKLASDTFTPTELLQTVSDVLPVDDAMVSVRQTNFTTLDVYHLRYCYLVRKVADWVRERSPNDPIWTSWLEEQRNVIGDENALTLVQTVKLFDWTVRNIAIEPAVFSDQTPPVPPLPGGLVFRGAGYRQTPFQTLFRGTGDWLQRSTTFISLCQQAGISASMLGLADGSGNLQPWACGVLVGEEVYLFDCRLGFPVPGPGQTGIGTLAQARRDASILRRMNVQGFFEYPFQKDNVQQCAALLMLEPETLSLRNQQLQDALTGDLRLVLAVDADELAKRWEAVPGIASVRIWDVPLQARIYEAAMQQITTNDPMVAFFTLAPWTILDGEFDQAKRLSLGRWRHLQGRFDDDEMSGAKAAKSLFLSQRQPEFEIEDLRIDVELQNQYGIRRELGITPEIYDRQIQQVQQIMRQGKVTATYWLSLIQFELAKFDVAETWFRDRVLGTGQQTRWKESARYGLARSLEELGQTDQAIEIYKTEGDVQEHGNRIRARLLSKAIDTSDEASTQ